MYRHLAEVHNSTNTEPNETAVISPN